MVDDNWENIVGYLRYIEIFYYTKQLMNKIFDA